MTEGRTIAIGDVHGRPAAPAAPVRAIAPTPPDTPGLAATTSRFRSIRKTSMPRPGADFLYGGRLPPDFPVDLYRRKWQRRGREEADDGTAAPGSWSSFLWEEVEPGLVPWAWRRPAGPGANHPPQIPLKLKPPGGYSWVLGGTHRDWVVYRNLA